jgi:ferredoxin
MVDVARHKNIELITCAEVTEVDGYVGNFKVKVKQNPRFVDTEKCTGCGLCGQVDIDESRGIKKDGYLLVDRVEIIDEKCKQCGDCVDACLEKNKDDYAMTNYFVERKRTHAGEKTHDIVSEDHHILMGDIIDMTRDEREEFWEEQFNKCIKCYSCREVCPLCVCKYCELEDSNWVKPGEIPPDYPIFHIIRAFHLAGKCVGCGECEKACPMDIPLRTLQDLVRNEDPETIFDIVPGLSRRMKHRLMKQIKRYPTEKRKVKI